MIDTQPDPTDYGGDPGVQWMLAYQAGDMELKILRTKTHVYRFEQQ